MPDWQRRMKIVITALELNIIIRAYVVVGIYPALHRRYQAESLKAVTSQVGR